MEPTSASGGRQRAHRDRKHHSIPTVQTLSLDTVRLYRAITADGRPYGRAGYAWDVVIAAVQELLLYTRRPAARGQAHLQRALNMVALREPPSVREAVRWVVIEYAAAADHQPTQKRLAWRRVRNAVAVLEAWDGQEWRRPPRLPTAVRRRRRGRGDAPRRPQATGPRGFFWQGRRQDRDSKGRWKGESS